MLYPVQDVWCCLAPTERDVSAQLLPFYITPPGWVEVALFDSFWAFYDPDNFTPRKQAYIAEYGLVFETVEVEPDVFVDVYRFTRSWWPNLFLFFSTTDPSCPEPCALVVFPPVA